ncbi:GDSL-like Lipase/Acylhydrolase-domain-containing protein [Dichotomocladium elegans]|nr:GDSL-like Lipase/Acylhydrolase-domain-containing protein [Dichotomocladium elegans]
MSPIALNVKASNVVFLAPIAQDTASTFSNIIAFGDSYTTDNSDVCNGPKWIRQLPWPNVSIENYAVGGAYCTDTGTTTSSSVTKQVNEFLKSRKADDSEDVLYSIMVGINDMVGNKSVDSVLRCIQDQVTRLHQEAGAKHFVLFNMAPFEISPSVAQEGTAAKSSAWIQTFNNHLASTVHSLSQSGVAIEPIDLYSTIYHVYEHPRDYGITRDPNTYYTQTNDPRTDPNALQNGNTYFWYNDAHLTSVVHSQIANAVDAKYRPQESPSAAVTNSGVHHITAGTLHAISLAFAVSVLSLY